MSEENNFPAYPLDYENGDTRFINEGMSLRCVFASKAPDVPEWFKQQKNDNINRIISDERVFFEWRWYYADAMLKAM